MSSRPYPSWRRRHYNVVDWFISHPAGTQKECAKATGYTESQLSRIVNAPEFYTRFFERRQLAREYAVFRDSEYTDSL